MSEPKKKFSLSPKQKSALTHALAVVLSLLVAGFGMPALVDFDLLVDFDGTPPSVEDSDAKPEAAPEVPVAPADTAAPVVPPVEEKAPEAAPV